jgi:hypothetical protein
VRWGPARRDLGSRSADGGRRGSRLPGVGAAAPGLGVGALERGSDRRHPKKYATRRRAHRRKRTVAWRLSKAGTAARGRATRGLSAAQEP